MKCESCDSAATFHTTEVDVEGDAVSRSLCTDHAREAGYPIPAADKMNASVISNTRMLADFLRKHRRMPSPGEMMEMGGAIGPPRQDTEKDINAYIVYLDSLAEFVDRNARFPTDDELQDPF